MAILGGRVHMRTAGSDEASQGRVAVDDNSSSTIRRSQVHILVGCSGLLSDCNMVEDDSGVVENRSGSVRSSLHVGNQGGTVNRDDIGVVNVKAGGTIDDLVQSLDVGIGDHTETHASRDSQRST